MEVRIKERNGEIKKLQNELNKAKDGLEEIKRMKKEDRDRFDKGKAEMIKDYASLKKQWEDLIKINENLERELKGEKEKREKEGREEDKKDPPPYVPTYRSGVCFRWREGTCTYEDCKYLHPEDMKGMDKG